MIRGVRHFLCLGILMGLLVGAPVMAQSPDGQGRLGILVFLSGDNLQDLVLPLDDLRRTASATLDHHFRLGDATPLPATDLDPLVGRWRVRDERSLSGPFLSELSDIHAVEHLLVVHLRASRTQLSLRSRLLTVPDGVVLDVQWLTRDLETPARGETESSALTMDWRRDLIALCRSLETTMPGPPTGPTRLLLPIEPVGCEPEHAMAATCALIQQWLLRDGCRMPDPAILFSALADRGVAPTRVDAAGRRWLAETYGAEGFWLASLITYGQGPKSVPLSILEDDQPTLAASRMPDFDLSLRRIDLQTGLINSGGQTYSPSAPRRGWFGHLGRITLKDRLQEATMQLIETHHPPAKER